MSDPKTCERCGAPLENADEPCPRCLLTLGRAKEPAAGAASTSARRARKRAVPALEEIARRFPELEVMAFVGEGGMGAVYKARQPKIERLVALKVLALDPSDDLTFAERFRREAMVMARLDHPSVVKLYDFGERDGLFFLVLEFVDGANLRTLMKQGLLEPKQALAIVPQMCEALQFAHDEGIVHRDIKPENVLIDARGASRSPTSAWRRSSTPTRATCRSPRSGRSWGRRTTWRPSSCAGRTTSTTARTSTRSASCSTRC